MASRLKVCAIALVFCVYILLLLEGSARIFVAIPSLFQTISKGAGCDAIWRIWWIKRHKKRNVDVFFSFDLYHPRRGWSLKPNVRGLEVFPGMIVNSNSKGVRGITEFPYERTGKKPRILVLGDSFTFGDEVSDHETYPYFLQQLLPDSEVINLGVHGYGHDQMLLYFLEEGEKYTPDIVILGFYSGDMDRNMLSFRDYVPKPKNPCNPCNPRQKKLLAPNNHNKESLTPYARVRSASKINEEEATRLALEETHSHRSK